jgi:AcrR family transcriptional regulator
MAGAPDAAGSTPPTRRAPFSTNPTVGARGLRTQQRILDAALQVFGELGYERSTLERIGQVAGCSRVSIYQYFAGKDDVFRHLAGQVAREMRASAEALEPLTPDEQGWIAIRAWVTRYAAIHQRYEAVFRAFGTAAHSDAALAGGSARIGERNVARFQSKLTSMTLPPRQLDAVVTLLLATVTRTLDVAAMLASAHPAVYTRDRVADAVADLLHRSLFGVVDGVNVRPPVRDGVPALRIEGTLAEAFARAEKLRADAQLSSRRALASLLDVGAAVIVERGYQGTRVDDVVTAAAVSHGAFYRYFRNMDEFVAVVAVDALGAVSGALAEIPDPNDRAALRRWLRRYNAVHSEKGAMIRVWAEAAEDPMRVDRAAAFDWGRRRMVRALRDRPFGDAELEGVTLLAAVETFGSIPRDTTALDATVHVIEQGLLGR